MQIATSGMLRRIKREFVTVPSRVQIATLTQMSASTGGQELPSPRGCRLQPMRYVEFMGAKWLPSPRGCRLQRTVVIGTVVIGMLPSPRGCRLQHILICFHFSFIWLPSPRGCRLQPSSLHHQSDNEDVAVPSRVQIATQ